LAPKGRLIATWRPTQDADTSFVPILTVMADYGDAPFLWLADSPDVRGIGPNICDGAFWGECYPMSEGTGSPASAARFKADRMALSVIWFVGMRTTPKNSCLTLTSCPQSCPHEVPDDDGLVRTF
jgi:hypothetical protein